MSEVKIHQVSQKQAIELTDSAKNHLIACLNKNQHAIGVRFSVKRSGCSGLSYVIDYVDTAGENDISFPLSAQYWVYIDANSIQYLQDVRVDYIKAAMGSKLVFTNPNQKGQCGCGESFLV